eukprot:3807089-Alexandrium_andersonii.AAC.1
MGTREAQRLRRSPLESGGGSPNFCRLRARRGPFGPSDEQLRGVPSDPPGPEHAREEARVY